MTWVTSGAGTRSVELPQRKRRKPARALRFAEIEVDDQIVRRWQHYSDEGSVVLYYIVTDLWFDPVAGQSDETAGRMVAIRGVDQRTGEPHGWKQAHTLRGLASQGFQYADVDCAVLAKVGIGHAHTIRKRPKVAGKPLSP